MEEIDADNCLQLTGHSLEYFINLTGIHGIHAGFAIDQAIDSAFTFHNNQVKVSIETDIVSELARTIHLGNMEISNDVMKKVKGARPGIGLDILCHQVDQARKSGYKAIVTQAYRDLKKSPEYDGYAMWGRYGFVMSPKSHGKFLEIMRKHSRPEQNIYDLQLHTEGRDFWKEHGILWIGEFDLEANSYSVTCLNDAVKARDAKLKGIKK